MAVRKARYSALHNVRKDTDSVTGAHRSAGRSHILIAGTGRAGTSFLVRYLTELGLDTELARAAHLDWDKEAQAGLETIPIATPAENLPYVIKSPWAGEFIDQLLAQDDFSLDVVIIPVRDMAEAAASRVILERRALYERNPWLARFSNPWETWGETPGGVVYSLDPLDQARILAVGFHRLVQQLVAVDVPVVFLAFPRLVVEWEYVFKKLRGFLPQSVTADAAKAAHQTVARAEYVRVGDELASDPSSSAPASAAGAGASEHPRNDELDAIAMRRELLRLREELQKQPGEPKRSTAQRDEMQTQIDRMRLEREAIRPQVPPSWRRLIGAPLRRMWHTATRENWRRKS